MAGGAFIDGDFSKLYVISGNFAANPDDVRHDRHGDRRRQRVIGSARTSGGEGWNGLAYDPDTGKMYAASG